MDLAHWVERSAAFTPDKLAIRFAGDDLNYAAFAERIRRTGSRLAALGVGRGDHVRDAVGGRGAAHGDRDVPGFRPVIYLGKDVRVNVDHD